jgi:hypothetical protein
MRKSRASRAIDKHKTTALVLEKELETFILNISDFRNTDLQRPIESGADTIGKYVRHRQVASVRPELTLSIVCK